MDDEELLARCRRGEDEAWRVLFDRYVRSVYRWAACLGLDSAAAEDASQEVFATAFRRIGDCRAAERLPAWLFQITRRKAANHRRLAWVRRVFGGGSNAGADLEPPAGGVGRDLVLDLRHTLGRLPQRDAEVLLLHDLDGQTRAEVATTLGISEGTVASRLARARAGFTRLWSEEEP